MKNISKILILSAMALALGACSNIERSRNLDDAKVSGNTLAQQVCSTCHGLNGQSINPTFPSLAAQSKDYLSAEMTEFKEHSRRDPAAQAFMWGIARNFTDKQIVELSDYFSKQTPLPNRAYSDPALLPMGKKVYDEGALENGVPGCSGCHGVNAEGLGPIPRLAGQHADYLYKQLMIFGSDYDEVEAKHEDELERGHGAVMEIMAHGLTNQQKLAVATYLQSLK